LDREEAIQRAKRALEEFIIDGIPTTISFHKQVLDNASFIEGEYDTHFIDREFPS
jgi:acetyl-CoA carboxylase biotin carboxylase subunit